MADLALSDIERVAQALERSHHLAVEHVAAGREITAPLGARLTFGAEHLEVVAAGPGGAKLTFGGAEVPLSGHLLMAVASEVRALVCRHAASELAASPPAGEAAPGGGRMTTATDMIQRQGRFRPATLNNEARTVELVWSTGARVLRQPWLDDPFFEALSLSADAVDLSRLNAGASLLNNHNANQLADVVGVVERAWIANGEARARVRFSSRPDVDGIWRDVQDGIIRNVSVGYTVQTWERSQGKGDPHPTLTATRWLPMELSLVGIPADAGAQVRNNPTAQKQMTSANPSPAAADLQQQLEQAERREAIRATCQRAGLTAEETESVLSEHGCDEAAACQAIIERQAVKQPVFNSLLISPDLGGDSSELEDLLVKRLRGKASGITTRDLMERTTGVRDTPTRLLRAAMATSDFPELFAGAGHRMLRDAYQASDEGARLVCRSREVDDLRDIALLGLSEFPALKKLGEGGEITYGMFEDRGGSYRVEEYAKAVYLTRRALLQDDIEAFGEAMTTIGQAVAFLEDELARAALEGSADGAACMEDGKALFHADHNNTTAASGLDIMALTEAAQMLREMEAVGINRKLNLRASRLLVPSGFEVVARQLVAGINPSKTDDASPFAAGGALALDVAVDANLSGGYSYLLVAPSSAAVALELTTGPAVAEVETEADFDTTSMKTRVLADRGLGVRDYRGVIRIPAA